MSIGVKCALLFDLLPMNRILIPKLHILLRIGNYLIENYYPWQELRIEKHPEAYLAVISEQSLHQIALDALLEELKCKKN